MCCSVTFRAHQHDRRAYGPAVVEQLIHDALIIPIMHSTYAGATAQRARHVAGDAVPGAPTALGTDGAWNPGVSPDPALSQPRRQQLDLVRPDHRSTSQRLMIHISEPALLPQRSTTATPRRTRTTSDYAFFATFPCLAPEAITELDRARPCPSTPVPHDHRDRLHRHPRRLCGHPVPTARPHQPTLGWRGYGAAAVAGKMIAGRLADRARRR